MEKYSKDFIQIDGGKIVQNTETPSQTIAITLDNKTYIDKDVEMKLKRTLLEIADEHPEIMIIYSTNNTMQLIQ